MGKKRPILALRNYAMAPNVNWNYFQCTILYKPMPYKIKMSVNIHAQLPHSWHSMDIMMQHSREI